MRLWDICQNYYYIKNYIKNTSLFFLELGIIHMVFMWIAFFIGDKMLHDILAFLALDCLSITIVLGWVLRKMEISEISKGKRGIKK
jgi:hypothetical protein